MSDETKAVLDWLDALCEQADTEVREGKGPALLNSFGKGIATYYTNVYKLRSMPREAFPHWHPAGFTEAKLVKAQYDALELTEKQAEKITALEDKLDKLAGMIEKLVEAKAEPESKTPAKRGKKALAEDKTDTKDEKDEPDTAAEQDAEEAPPPAETAAEEDSEEAKTD